jgi:hypothetical protein
MKISIEWLVEQWPILESQLPSWLIEQAKEMEKQNIIESYCQGCFDMWKDNGIVPRETSEDYYNRTFKSE